MAKKAKKWGNIENLTKRKEEEKKKKVTFRVLRSQAKNTCRSMKMKRIKTTRYA